MTADLTNASIDPAPDMTPAEVRAFNQGVEAVRGIARRERARCRDFYFRQGCRGTMFLGMQAACKNIEDAGAALIHQAPEVA